MLIKPTLRNNEYYSKFFKMLNLHFSNEIDLPKGTSFILAVSGGVDSAVMLDVFANLAEENAYHLVVAHFNHMLRGEHSDKDLALVKDLAKNYGLQFYSSSGDVKGFAKENSLSIEHAARTLRYRYLSQIAQNLKINYILTAHTSDDVAETFLSHLFRGSGLTGLSGIPQKRKLSKTSYLFRPFLNLNKSELIEYAQNRDLKWQEDESNSMLFYTRNKIRNVLIKNLETDYNPGIKEVLNRTAKLLKGADDFINEHVQMILPNVTKDKSSDRFALGISLLNTFPDFIKGEIIQTSLMENLKLQPVSLGTIDRIITLCDSPTGSMADISKKIFVLKDRDYLIFSKRQPSDKQLKQIEKTGEYQLKQGSFSLKEVSKKDVKISEDPNIEFFDYDSLPIGLTVRSWEPGDFFQPIGMEGTIKISDFLTNMKIPLIDKDRVTLLTFKNEVVWVMGMRISEKYKVTNSTLRYLKAVFKKENTGQKK